MAIVQISRITQRKGLAVDLPEPLAGAELGWAVDTRRLYIGNGTLQEGAPVVGNTEVLTQFSDILSYMTEYTYQGQSGGYTAQTGLTPSSPISQSIQSRLDSFAVITDFGATGDGVTDVTENINNALYQLYCRDAANPATRRSLYFPAGTYIISDTINIPPYCDLYGDGPESTIISFYVPAWTDTIAYASGVLVESGGDYYRSKSTVPIDIDIGNTIYWEIPTTGLPSGLSPYIVRTADSLQQTGDNIGTNGASLPGSFSVSNMKFVTNQVMDGVLVEAAKDCTFESVNVTGPETETSLTANLDLSNSACVRMNSTGAATCNNVEWNHGTFKGMVWGSNTDEQVQAITFTNCSFDTLYQGVYLGTASPGVNYVGPTGVRIAFSEFNNIYAEGISIVNVGLNCSAYNVFYDVGNHFLGTIYPYTPIIDIDGTNNVSVGDMFERTVQYSAGVRPCIKLNNLNGIVLGMNVNNITYYQNGTSPGTPYNFANQLTLGSYQRTSGIQDNLTVSGSAQTLFTFDADYIAAVKIDYTIKTDGDNAVRTGTYTIVRSTSDSTGAVASSDSGIQNSDTGVVFSVSEDGPTGEISWKYTTSNSGTINYSITKLA